MFIVDDHRKGLHMNAAKTKAYVFLKHLRNNNDVVKQVPSIRKLGALQPGSESAAPYVAVLLCIPILFYGSESWTLSPALNNLIEAFKDPMV